MGRFQEGCCRVCCPGPGHLPRTEPGLSLCGTELKHRVLPAQSLGGSGSPAGRWAPGLLGHHQPLSSNSRQAGATVRGQQVSLSLGAVELEGGLPGGGDREHMGNSICKGSKLGEFRGLYGEVRS